MRILLINPPAENISSPYVEWGMQTDDIGFYPPLGLMYIASYLRKNTNFEVKILDTIVERLNQEEISRILKEYNPKLVGLTSFTLSFYDLIQTINTVKTICPSAHVCIGGPHTHHWHNEIIKKTGVDSVIVGEGEITFTQLSKAINEGGNLKRIKGLIFKEGTKIIETGSADFIANLDELPFPAYELVPHEKYCSIHSTKGPIATIITSRGCPHNCSYCDKQSIRYRSRSVENSLDEIQMHYNNGVREFIFFDDTFNLTPQRVIDVSKEIIDRKLYINWLFRGRVDQITDEMIAIAKKAGCSLISFGIEDCSNEGFRMINKGITIEQVIRAIDIVKRYDIEISTNWIIGLPRHKTKEDIMGLLKFAQKLDSTYAEFSMLTVYQGTQMFHEGVQRGVIDKDVWEKFVLNPKKDFLPPIWDEILSREELSKLYHRCYVGYYYRPGYILKSLRKIKSWRELYKKFIAAMTLIGIELKK